MEFAGKVALVTGGGRGIGAAVVDQLSSAGADVVVNDLDGELARRVVGRVERTGRRGLVSTADVTAAAAVEAMFAEVDKTFGRLDILVNNVGGSSGGARLIRDITPEDWERVVSLNLRSTFLCVRAAVPLMRASGGGRIVNVASIAGQSRSFLGGCQYAASKAGVLGLTRHLAGELAPLGININAVAPGTTGSERVTAAIGAKSEAERTAIFAQVPLGRIGRPEEVAAAIVFLCSPLAGYITGATIDVNGGANCR